MGTCCFIPWFLRDAMVCPNSDSVWHCLLWSSLDGGEHCSSLVLRKLGRELVKGSVFNSCVSMRTWVWISNTHVKSQLWPQTLLGLVLWETETKGS